MKQIPITINETDEESPELWRVTFIGDFATIIATVESVEDDAVTLAENMLTDYYGWDLSHWRTEVESPNECD
jgi:hypothetical protein